MMLQHDAAKYNSNELKFKVYFLEDILPLVAWGLPIFREFCGLVTLSICC
jgi:hypothetical protein